MCITLFFRQLQSYTHCKNLTAFFHLELNSPDIIMQHPEKETQISVPFHSGKEVKRGLLAGILKHAQIKTDKR